MNELKQRIAGLTLKQRALLETRLRDRSSVPGADSQIPRRSTTSPCPPSFAQERLWFLTQMDPGSAAYNINRALHLRGPLNREALQKSLDTLIARHESLRTTLQDNDGAPVQVIAPERKIEIAEINLAAGSSQPSGAEIKAILQENIERPFDVARDLMLRAALVGLAPEEHILVLSMHHIASDGWSMGVLSRELTELYAAFAEGREPRLPALPIQYADFALWQREWLQGEVFERQLNYWKNRLDGVKVLDLPTDGQRPPIQTYRGASLTAELPQALTKTLRRLSSENRASLFMTLLAAFQTWLFRYTGESDLCVGSPIANRVRVETEGLIGFFANTQVLRGDLSGDPTFRELLGRMREAALDAYAHQDMPFEKLVERLHPQRSLSHSPLFQVMFALQNAPSSTLQLGELVARRVPLESDVSKFDLSMVVLETGPSLKATLEYNTDLFSAATAQRMLSQLQVLLEGIAANPEERISKLPLLTAAERRQLLVEWNATEAEYPRGRCIHELIEEQAERTPDEAAVCWKDQRLTYRQLNRKANHLARRLRRLGVGPGSVVGLCMDRCPELMVGLLGILKAGGCYLPLDPFYPRERLALMFEDSRATVLVTKSEWTGCLPDSGAERVLLEDGLPEAIDDEDLVGAASAEDCAYVIYTSGSTGKPKGTLISHQALVNHTSFVARKLNHVPGTRFLQFNSMSFDVAAAEIFPAWISGGTVVLWPERAATISDFLRILEKEQIHCVDLPTAYWNEWVAEMASSSLKMPASLRSVVVGGDRVIPEKLATWRKHAADGVRWINAYGPTETTITAAFFELEPADAQRTTVPIGRPLDNVQLYVLDNNLEPVPVGVPGELYIGGDGVAIGYLNRPELTAQRFIPNPFVDDPTARLYKTGDRVRYLSDGNLDFVGRADFQVKVRGFRIELGEIEAALAEHPSVRQAAVGLLEDTPGEKQLIAYVVAQRDCSPPAAELREFLRNQLPPHMLPAQFVFLDQLPLTPGGKVDRKALPAPEAAAVSATTFVAPHDELELQLTKIWEKVLARSPIGVRESFFDSGGHSLLAVRLFAQIEQLTGKRLPLATLFQAPTIEQLAAVLRDNGWTPPWTYLVPIQPGGSKPPLFCVHGGAGHALDFYPLSRRLGPDQPVYGLESPALDGKPGHDLTVEQMASLYLDEIQKLQPQGPYLISGYCFGGNIAYEIAQQLRQRGQQAALLAIFHSSGQDYPKRIANVPWHKRVAYKLIDRLDLEFSNLADQKSKDRLLQILVRFRRMFDVLKIKWERRQDRKLGVDRKHSFDYVIEEVKEVNARAARKYVRKPYDGRVLLFAASKQGRLTVYDPTLGWGLLLQGPAEIHKIEGHHEAIIREPRVQQLADKLAPAMVEAMHAALRP